MKNEMEMVRISLVDKDPVAGTMPLFPADYYAVPGVSCFQDADVASRWAKEQLSAFAGQPTELYINGGLAIEIHSALWALEALSMPVRIFHWDTDSATYLPQEFRWHHSRTQSDRIAKFLLCPNRHPMPETETIFSFQEIPKEKIFDFQWQEQQAEIALAPFRGQRAEIYLTGLKPLQISVLNAASRLGIAVTWLHYDFSTKSYFPQDMDACL